MCKKLLSLCKFYCCLISLELKLLFPCLIFSKDVNFEELARCTDDFNGAQLKAVCVEAVSIDGNLHAQFCMSHYLTKEFY